MDKRTRQRRANKVAALLETDHMAFDMRRECSCIMARVQAAAGQKLRGESFLGLEVGAWLGMSPEAAKAMFYPVRYFDLSDPRKAASVVRHYGKTGAVDWSIVGKPT